MKDYIVLMSIRGNHTLIVKNCKSKAEARRKLIEQHPDVEGVTFDIDKRFPKSAKIYVDKPKKQHRSCSTTKGENMGINRITAIEIQTNGDNIKCSAGGPAKENGKYVGWIELWRDGDLHKPMISTQPVFDTESEAIKAMENIVVEIRALDLKEIMTATQLWVNGGT